MITTLSDSRLPTSKACKAMSVVQW